MFRLEPHQHGQILGFALIGYGTYLLLNVVSAVLQLWLTTTGLTSSAKNALLPEALGAAVYFGVSMLAGLDVRYMRRTAMATGILFVCLAIGQFPLGTILSAYILVFLFVIKPAESTIGVAPQATSDENE